MASSYPGSADSFTTIASDKKTSDSVGGRTHRDMHNDLGDAIEAVQGELGTDPAGSYSTVKARLEAIEGGTLPPIDAKGDLLAGTADNTYDNVTVGANDTVLVADSSATAGVKWANVTSAMITNGTIATADLADSAVTSAKIADGTIVAADVAASTFAAHGTVGNLLTANQASVETDTTGFTASVSTLARISGGSHGTYCLEITNPTGNDYPGVYMYGSGSAGTMPVTAGDTYTFQALVKAPSITRNVKAHVRWFTGDGTTSAGTAAISSAVALSTSWKLVTVTGVAPATAVYASLNLYVDGTSGVGEVYHADCLSFHKGASGQWALPGVPVTGQSHIATNGAMHLSGTGTPESVVTAPPGSTWLQTDSTTDVKGWIRWVKATGTGNTGWVAGPEADTGWRDVSAGLINGWATNSGAPRMEIRRVGSLVSVRGLLDASSSSDLPLYNLPSGFTFAVGSSYAYQPVPAHDGATGVSVAIEAHSIGYIRSAVATTVALIRMGGSWHTPDAWPSSLPGS